MESVEILDSFYSHTFLSKGNKYIVKFMCYKGKADMSDLKL